MKAYSVALNMELWFHRWQMMMLTGYTQLPWTISVATGTSIKSFMNGTRPFLSRHTMATSSTCCLMLSLSDGGTAGEDHKQYGAALSFLWDWEISVTVFVSPLCYFSVCLSAPCIPGCWRLVSSPSFCPRVLALSKFPPPPFLFLFLYKVYWNCWT